MTSKEVLEICKEICKDRNTSLASAKEGQNKSDEDAKHLWDDDIDYLQSQVDFYERIIQDLEILEIIKTKKVNMNLLWTLSKWDDNERASAEYNKYIVERHQLTELEFKLLKDIL